MTEPLTPDQDKNRIRSQCWQAAKTDQPMLFHIRRPALPRHVTARIFRPSRSVMTSARGTARPWRLVFERRTPPFIDPLMGYTGGDDTLTHVQLHFPTREAAIAFAERQKFDFVVQDSPPERPRPNVRKLRADPGACVLTSSHTKENNDKQGGRDDQS
ncbi:ETC complex I subunit [Mesorhizobium sp. CC13]|uniref:NADH dehydrogenase ubiquinone Fe-S protein 4 n=1 Tax=Mesorhizobium sp. CC13 TaxID=3029194 RepID=UPI00326357E6